MSSIVLIGLNHRTAEIALRDLFALNGAGLCTALAELLQMGAPHSLRETAILSTCNRFEVYAATDDPAAAATTIERYLAHRCGFALSELRPRLYQLEQCSVVNHLLRVASGLDSMILGEPQILGQVAEALEIARATGAAGFVLGQLFQRAVHCGKRARAETDIGRYTTSISHAAAMLAARHSGGPEGWHALVVGAGEMAELACVALAQHGVVSITCINRTLERAQRLAERVQGRALTWSNLAAALREADVVVSATTAPHTVIDAPTVAQAMAGRGGRPMLFIDLAVPRDVEPEVGGLPGVTRFDIDHLRDVVDSNRGRRLAAVPQVEQIIAAEECAFLDWLHGRQIAPTLTALRRQVHCLAEAELRRTLRRLASSTANSGAESRIEEELAHLTHRIVHKLLHQPTVRLKAQAVQGNAAIYTQVVRDLFALDALPISAKSAGTGGVAVSVNGSNGARHD